MKESPMWSRTLDNLFGPSEFIGEWNDDKNWIGYGYNKRLDLVADEAIFRKLVRYNKDHPEVIPMLGQRGNDLGYGIINLAAKLGSKFLDKLDEVVDYRATSRTIELLWVATGIAIHLYKEKRNTVELTMN
ncbi:11813_t:CDS:2 [Entrophospora sp. SA101]|nr:11813_t:CDS:2 [Entrophospora sp. SA101]